MIRTITFRRSELVSLLSAYVDDRRKFEELTGELDRIGFEQGDHEATVVVDRDAPLGWRVERRSDFEESLRRVVELVPVTVEELEAFRVDHSDPSLLEDPDYVRASCGAIVHVDDLDDHGSESCELCEELGS